MQNTIKTLTLTALMASSLYAVDCTQTYKVQSFAQRFYVEVLERQPDNGGLDGWTNDLTSRAKTGTDVANGFIFSEEFVAKDKTNEAFVTIMYRAFFNRPAAEDAEGYAYWLEKLNNNEGKEAVSHGFLYSQEFANLSATYGIQAYEGATFTTTALDNFVKRFYSVILGRDADQGGLKSWTDKLSTNEATGSDIAFGFILSAEYDMASKTDTEYINTLYSAFFNRTADEAGFNGWMTQLNGGTTREEVLDGFLHSQEFINLTNSFGILAFDGAPEPSTGENVAPVANAGASQTINLGSDIILDASNSTDADGTVECNWWVENGDLLSTDESFNADLLVGTHNIRLTVVDDDGVSKSVSVNITVQDTPPVITSSNTVTIAENQLSALTALAIDAQGSVSYSLSGGDSADFSINTTMGVIVFNNAPDFETRDTYSFTVTVTDSAGQSVSQTVTVHISDVAEGQAPKKTGQTKSYDVSGTEVTDGSLKDDGFYQKGTTPSYTRDDASNIVTDHLTGLEWQDDVEAKAVTKNWADAKTYCSTLSLDGGGWRLSTRKELVGLSDYVRTNPSINPTFVNVASDNYWSSTANAGSSSNAWYVYFNLGYQHNYTKSTSFYVRCVRRSN